MFALLALPLGAIITWSLASFVGRLIVGLGVGVVAYQGVDLLVGQMTALLDAQLGGIDPLYFDAVEAFGLRTAFQWIMAAYVARVGTQTAYRLALRRAAA